MKYADRMKEAVKVGKRTFAANYKPKANWADDASSHYGAGVRAYVAFASASLPKSTKFDNSPLNDRLKLNDNLSILL